MNVTSFEAVVVNGQITLPDNVHLPEQAKVYVFIPGIHEPGAVRLMSPRLARPEQAADFQKTVVPNVNG